jgi:fructose-specific phosphotransferase system IIA component
MKVSDYLQEKFCIMDLKAADKVNAVKEITTVLLSSGKISNEEKFVRDVLEREKIGSTGIGHGVAIPHARTDAVDGFVIGFGRSNNGVEFSALDGHPVNFIFLMGTNPTELNHYLRILAELSKLLMSAPFRQELFAANSAAGVIEVVKRFEV